MNWLLALLAFAAIMAVLSTMVSVLVEALHKVFAMRSGGLREMLRGMHAGIVSDLDPAEASEGKKETVKAAKSFADVMSQSPAYNRGGGATGVGRYFSTNVFSHRYQNLTNLQFAEQLPRTDYGKRLAAQPRPEVRRHIKHLLWQFDRFGESQTDFFRRRAKIYTTLVSLGFVMVANVNAISIYRYLAENEQATQGVLALFETSETSSQLDTLNRTAANLTAELDRVEATISAATGDTSDLIDDIAQFQDIVQNTSVEFNLLAEAGLPIGHGYFPYCAGQNPEVLGVRDASPGCENYADAQAKLAALLDGGQPSDRDPGILSWTLTRPSAVGIWLLSAIATAGLLGLGAPFWFNTFRALAVLADRRVAVPPQPSEKDGKKATPVTPPAARTVLTESDIDAYTDAFLMEAGQEVPASGDRLASVTTSAGDDGAAAGVRQVRR